MQAFSAMCRSASIVAAVAALSVGSGCASDDLACLDGDDSQQTADCLVLLRVDGREYAPAGFRKLKRPDLLIPGGRAEVSECDDTGPCVRGPHFSRDPETVRIFRIKGRTDHVIVVRHGGQLALYRPTAAR